MGDVVVATQYRYGDVDATCFGSEHGQVPQMPAKYDLDDYWLDVARQAAAQYGIPVLAIKAVSDITGHGGDTADSFDENLDDVAKHSAHFTEPLVQQILSSSV